MLLFLAFIFKISRIGYRKARYVMLPQYIGICDIQDPGQAREFANFFDSLCDMPETAHLKLGIGLMMSYKTLKGLPSRWTNVWVKAVDVASTFIKHPRVFNIFHYADYDGETDLADLLEAVKYGGPHLHALQLDMIWPSEQKIANVRKFHPDLHFVLQVNKAALDQVYNRPDILIEQLKKYVGCVDYVLLDKSMGRGVPMKVHELRPFARVISEQLPEMVLVFGGRLGPYTMDAVAPLIEEFPRSSVDMQSQLRLSGNAMDPICPHRVDKALVSSVDLFKKVK